MSVYPNRPKNVAQESDAGPAPNNTILAFAFLGDGVLGSRICLTPILLKTSVANCCSPPMLIPPSSVACKLQPPTQRSLVGQTMPHVIPNGLSEKIAFAAP